MRTKKTKRITMTDKQFREAVLAASVRAAFDQELRDTCPKDSGGCGRRGVLVRLTHRGVCLGKMCPNPDCGWSTFASDADQSEKQRKPAKRKAQAQNSKRSKT